MVHKSKPAQQASNEVAAQILDFGEPAAANVKRGQAAAELIIGEVTAERGQKLPNR
jgi:hypothetical protein